MSKPSRKRPLLCFVHVINAMGSGGGDGATVYTVQRTGTGGKGVSRHYR